MENIQQFLGPNGLIYSVEDNEGNINILWGGKLYYSFNMNNLFAKNLGIALLDRIGVIQKTICDFFKVSRNTITNISKIYKEDGIDGLKNYKHGAPAVEEELRAFVIKKYIGLGNTRGYQNIILKAVEEKVKEGDFKGNTKPREKKRSVKSLKKEKPVKQKKKTRRSAKKKKREMMKREIGK
jgi:hypothetical protein